MAWRSSIIRVNSASIDGGGGGSDGAVFLKRNKYKSKQQIVFESYTNIFACKNQTRAIQKQERGNHKFAKI